VVELGPDGVAQRAVTMAVSASVCGDDGNSGHRAW